MRIKGETGTDRLRNVDFREKLRQEGVSDLMKRRQESGMVTLEEMSIEWIMTKMGFVR